MIRFIKYNISFSKPLAWVILLCVCVNGTAQNIDTNTHQLNEVPIIVNKQTLLQASKKQLTFDSLVLSKYNTTSLADLLANQSTVHIKSYGNGNLATTSLRGGSSNHTALLWNGLNIQNPMLGQTDLSIIPTLLFDNVSLEYGGGSAMWGSGAIGGSIHLQNKTLFDQGFSSKLQLSVGSYGNKKIASGIILSYKKLISNTRLYYNTSDNNYSYKDTADHEQPTKQITHSNYVTKGIMQEVSFLATAYQKIGVRLWYNKTDRNLPSYTSSISKQNQEDENLKLSADWNYNRGNLNSIIRLAYFNDQINYTDSIASIFSESKVSTLIAESDNVYTLNRHKFNLGVNITSFNSETKNYAQPQQLNKIALFAAYQISFYHDKLHYNLSVRKEHTSLTTIPFTGNTGLHYQLTKQFALKVNASRSYRQPSLNDLYWNPGGNPDLKPEDSYEGDGSIEYKLQRKKISLIIEGTYFNRHTTNWIIWLPTDNAYWSPRNIAEVYSRGTETKSELAYSHKDLKVKLSASTSYVLSTNQKTANENDRSEGRQLIYTPRYNGNATLMIAYKGVSILFNQNYTGYRFTSTDNTTWLYPYYLANLKLSYKSTLKNMNMELFGNINNVFNTNYRVVSNRPMPLRNYEAGINLQYHKPKNKSLK